MCSSAPTSTTQRCQSKPASPSGSSTSPRPRTCQGTDRPSAALLHLGDNTRGPTCGSHHVRERIERTRPLSIRRRRLSVVGALVRRLALGIRRERGFCFCFGGGGCGRLERRRGRNGRERREVWLGDGLGWAGGGGPGREVEGRKRWRARGQRIGRGGCRGGVGWRIGVGCAFVVAG